MKLTINKCYKCNKVRLVDKTPKGWMCFACKQGKTPESKRDKIKKPVKKIRKRDRIKAKLKRN